MVEDDVQAELQVTRLNGTIMSRKGLTGWAKKRTETLTWLAWGAAAAEAGGSNGSISISHSIFPREGGNKASNTAISRMALDCCVCWVLFSSIIIIISVRLLCLRGAIGKATWELHLWSRSPSLTEEIDVMEEDSTTTTVANCLKWFKSKWIHTYTNWERNKQRGTSGQRQCRWRCWPIQLTIQWIKRYPCLWSRGHQEMILFDLL